MLGLFLISETIFCLREFKVFLSPTFFPTLFQTLFTLGVDVSTGCDKEVAFELARANEKVAPFLEGKTMVKEIYVPNKIVNFVVR